MFLNPILGQREHLYVPGSPEARMAIVGDVVGPGFFRQNLTAEQIMRKPYGSGEGNMFNFAYSVYNLKYLKASNQLRPETLAQVCLLFEARKSRCCLN